MDDALRAHVRDAARITSPIARKRAVAFLAKQMRKEEDETLDAIRDALQNVKVKTVMGMVEFDANGDIKSKVVSVYQIKKDAAKGLDDPSAQYKYIGVAPEA